MKKKPVNNCPKAERCIHASACINHDTFRGEYLCFDGGIYSAFEHAQRSRRAKQQHKNREKGGRKC